MNKNLLIKLDNIFKSFVVGSQEIEIIKDISFTVSEGEFLVIFGPSGCGKSTLLHIMLGLERPTKGLVEFLGKDLYQYREDQRSRIRKRGIGMIYQQANWIKALNVLENVSFPLTLMGVLLAEREKRAWEALELVGMKQGAHQVPTELSSGQQQRIALARALISNPALIIADEPTGNLDSKAGEEMMRLFKKLNEKQKTIIMVTHDLEYITYASRAVNIVDGKLVGDYSAKDRALKKFIVSKKGNNHNLHGDQQLANGGGSSFNDNSSDLKNEN